MTILPTPLLTRQAGLLAALALLLLVKSAFGDWQQDDKTLVWKNDDKTVWRFSYDTTKGKPYFDPVTVAGGPELTNFKPTDHPWHYGLWFSWKYINHVNYWEEDRTTGQSGGATKWEKPEIATKPDGSATMKMNVSYHNPNGTVDMSEARELAVSAPATDGSYSIEWRMHFTAGKDGAILDRTAMPGEPGGQVNGGYAGLSIRMAGQPMLMSVVTPSGPVEKFTSSRARPNAPAVGCNFTKDGKDVGAVAILSDPANLGGPDGPWYLINDNTTNSGEGFRFACAAILAPKIVTLKAGDKMDLHYQIALSPKAWTPDSLKAVEAAWVAASKSAGQ